MKKYRISVLVEVDVLHDAGATISSVHALARQQVVAGLNLKTDRNRETPGLVGGFFIEAKDKVDREPSYEF